MQKKEEEAARKAEELKARAAICGTLFMWTVCLVVGAMCPATSITLKLYTLNVSCKRKEEAQKKEEEAARRAEELKQQHEVRLFVTAFEHGNHDR